MTLQDPIHQLLEMMNNLSAETLGIAKIIELSFFVEAFIAISLNSPLSKDNTMRGFSLYKQEQCSLVDAPAQ
jgi:hypothetical protein